MNATSRPRALIAWSGGKDCCLALLRAESEYDVVGLVTMFNDDGSRSRSHGLRPAVVDAHARRLGLPAFCGRASWANYTAEFIRVLGETRALDATHVVFGDIMFDTHRRWNEAVCAAHGLQAVMPMWGESTAALARDFVARGGQAAIVTVRAPLDASWLGVTLTGDRLTQIEALGADACGENGEYHTLVFDCPRFASPLAIEFGVTVPQADCFAVDVRLADDADAEPPARLGHSAT